MPATNIPVHVFVDEMTVIDGPSAEALNTIINLTSLGQASEVEHTFRMTLTTPASSREFKRKVTITDVDTEIKFFERFSEGPRYTGSFIIKGFIGDWWFSGVYEPRGRRGVLTQVDSDYEFEQRQLIKANGLPQAP